MQKVVSLQTDKKSLLDALKDGPYGRCVYHCDNDVVDHQVVNLEFDNGVTASMTMCAFTNKCERIINLMGTKGQIRGNMEENEIIVEDFASGNTTKIKVKVPKGRTQRKRCLHDERLCGTGGREAELQKA